MAPRRFQKPLSNSATVYRPWGTLVRMAVMESELRADSEGRELASALVALEGERRRIEGEMAVLIACADESGAFVEDGHATVTAWAQATCNWSPAEAKARTRLARLDGRMPSVVPALRCGRIGVAQAMELARLWANPRARHHLPDSEEVLVTQAGRLWYLDFQTVCRRWEALADENGAHRDHDRARFDRRVARGNRRNPLPPRRRRRCHHRDGDGRDPGPFRAGRVPRRLGPGPAAVRGCRLCRPAGAQRVAASLRCVARHLPHCRGRHVRPPQGRAVGQPGGRCRELRASPRPLLRPTRRPARSDHGARPALRNHERPSGRRPSGGRGRPGGPGTPGDRRFHWTGHRSRSAAPALHRRRPGGRAAHRRALHLARLPDARPTIPRRPQHRVLPRRAHQTSTTAPPCAYATTSTRPAATPPTATNTANGTSTAPTAPRSPRAHTTSEQQLPGLRGKRGADIRRLVRPAPSPDGARGTTIHPMSAVRRLARTLRRQLAGSMLVIALVVGLAGGLATGLVAGAAGRTTAGPRAVRSAMGGLAVRPVAASPVITARPPCSGRELVAGERHGERFHSVNHRPEAFARCRLCVSELAPACAAWGPSDSAAMTALVVPPRTVARDPIGLVASACSATTTR